MRVDGARQAFGGMIPIQVEGGYLSQGVYARVGAPGNLQRFILPAQPAQGFFKFSLRSRAMRLPLTA